MLRPSLGPGVGHTHGAPPACLSRTSINMINVEATKIMLGWTLEGVDVPLATHSIPLLQAL